MSCVHWILLLWFFVHLHPPYVLPRPHRRTRRWLMRWSWRPWWRRAIRCGTSGRSTTSASWTRWRPSDAGPKGKHKYHRENELTSIVTMKNRVRTYKDHEGPWRTIIFFGGGGGCFASFDDVSSKPIGLMVPFLFVFFRMWLINQERWKDSAKSKRGCSLEGKNVSSTS